MDSIHQSDSHASMIWNRTRFQLATVNWIGMGGGGGRRNWQVIDRGAGRIRRLLKTNFPSFFSAFTFLFFWLYFFSFCHLKTVFGSWWYLSAVLGGDVRFVHLVWMIYADWWRRIVNCGAWVVISNWLSKLAAFVPFVSTIPASPYAHTHTYKNESIKYYETDKTKQEQSTPFLIVCHLNLLLLLLLLLLLDLCWFMAWTVISSDSVIVEYQVNYS